MARRYVIMSGVINGVNRTFTLPGTYTYVTGSMILIHNGLSIHQTDTQGFTEVNTTTILMNIAPQTDDVILAFFDDGVIEEVAFDLIVSSNTEYYQIDMTPLEFKIEYSSSEHQLTWTPSEFMIPFSTSLPEVTYVGSSFIIDYSVNTFTVE